MVTHCKKLLAAIALALATACVGNGAAAQLRAEHRVVIDYVVPFEAAHNEIRDVVMKNEVLERVRDLLAPVRWPRTLRVELKGCEGEANAWYSDGIVTVCYEFLDDMWRRANASGRPAALARDDAFIGPLTDVVLHESGHALFELLEIPVLGREEDAADQVSAYYLLQLPSERKRALVLGAAYAYASEIKVRNARDLYKPRLAIRRHATFADEHGTPAQRLYNLLCLAYGADKQLFASLVENGYLPMERAEICEAEYQQVSRAFDRLIRPHITSGP